MLQILFVTSGTAQQHSSFQSALYRDRKHVEVARLNQVIGRAHSDRVHDPLGASDAGNNDYSGVLIVLGNAAKQLDSAQPGHLHVGDNESKWFTREQLQSLLSIGRRL